MRIDRTLPQAAEAYSQRVQRAAEEAVSARPAEAGPGSSVDVRISDRSLELQHVKELASQAPDVRAERVQALKSSIEAGSYHVPAREIAAKLLGGGLDVGG